MSSAKQFHFVIIGGGIAGVTCAETLAHLTDGTGLKTLLISASPLIKAVINHQQIGHTLESMDVTEQTSESLTSMYPNVTVIHDQVSKINTDSKLIYLRDDKDVFSYNKLCMATGASPKFLSDNAHVMSIRDTDSVKALQHKLKFAQRIAIVGNGGIATELAYAVDLCEVVWCIKHKSISAAFFDESAAQFFLPHVQETQKQNQTIIKRWKYTETVSRGSLGAAEPGSARGNALGPDWAEMFKLSGSKEVADPLAKVKLEYEVETDCVMTPDEFKSCPEVTEATGSNKSWPVYIKLTNGKVYGADVIINATGVSPACDVTFTGNEKISMDEDDFGVLIDMEMRSSILDVYAAGDVVNTSKWENNSQWHQMRLWTQAKQMGCYAAKCMFNHLNGVSVEMDICFDLFSHITQFFGFKVVLLGLYNAQGLNTADYTVLIRCTKGEEYIKAIVHHGRLVGAVLIGDTDLEETFENLILNQLDISHVEDHLLDPDIDIADYFD